MGFVHSELRTYMAHAESIALEMGRFLVPSRLFDLIIFPPAFVPEAPTTITSLAAFKASASVCELSGSDRCSHSMGLHRMLLALRWTCSKPDPLVEKINSAQRNFVFFIRALTELIANQIRLALFRTFGSQETFEDKRPALHCYSTGTHFQSKEAA